MPRFAAPSDRPGRRGSRRRRDHHPQQRARGHDADLSDDHRRGPGRGRLARHPVRRQQHLPGAGRDHFDPSSGRLLPELRRERRRHLRSRRRQGGADEDQHRVPLPGHHPGRLHRLSNSDGFGPYDGSVGKLGAGRSGGRADPTDVRRARTCSPRSDRRVPDAAATTCTPGSAANIFSSISESFVILAEARGRRTFPTPDARVVLPASLQCANGGFTDKTSACGARHRRHRRDLLRDHGAAAARRTRDRADEGSRLAGRAARTPRVTGSARASRTRTRPAWPRRRCRARVVTSASRARGCGVSRSRRATTGAGALKYDGSASRRPRPPPRRPPCSPPRRR